MDEMSPMTLGNVVMLAHQELPKLTKAEMKTVENLIRIAYQSGDLYAWSECIDLDSEYGNDNREIFK